MKKKRWLLLFNKHWVISRLRTSRTPSFRKYSTPQCNEEWINPCTRIFRGRWREQFCISYCAVSCSSTPTALNGPILESNSAQHPHCDDAAKLPLPSSAAQHWIDLSVSEGHEVNITEFSHVLSTSPKRKRKRYEIFVRNGRFVD